jgi:hypothetical protein
MESDILCRQQRREAGLAKKITGTVSKIVNGRPTDQKSTPEKAFSDIE